MTSQQDLGHPTTPSDNGDGQTELLDVDLANSGHRLPRREATITKPGLDDRGGVFFAAIEMTRMPMVLTDPNLPDNPIVFANNAFEDLTGYAQAEIVNRNCRFLQGARTDRSKVTELRQAIAEQRAVSVELLNYKRDGTPFWNAVYIAPVFDRDGRLLYFFASQLDITRRRTSEQALHQAQKMESVGQLTAGLAHDFNNLLQIVSGNLEMLKSKLTDPAVRRYAQHAEAAAERGAKLTTQLLAFARKTRLEPKVLDINRLIHDFSEVLRSTAGGTVDLRFDLAGGLPATRIDAVHLEMALLNILINARDAMPGGGTVTIATAAVRDADHAGTHVSLSVVDEGEGMPDHVRERATEPFFTTKPVGKGSGLGLAMVHGFAQQSGGRLDITSERGRGTTVRMLFPAVPHDIDVPAPVVSGPTYGPTGATVLVVEDNEDVLALATEWLADVGYRVIAARSGAEALALLDSHGQNIQLLFTDLVMPGGINGFTLAERVRERVPDVAVLLTTGYNEDLAAEAPRTRSMDVLSKPYRRSELNDRVRHALMERAHPAHRRDPPETSGPKHEG